MPDPLPVLWLCGPPGTGKSTVAWELHAQWAGSAHVDIDQLGMCFPEIPSDPGRTVLEARVLGRAVANFAAAGARCLIVSGCVDSRRGVHSEHLAGADLTVVRLRCDLPELRRRLVARARPGEPLGAALREAGVLDRSLPGVPVLDTTGRAVAEVVAAVRERWPEPPARAPGRWPEPPGTPGEVLWLCGATAVGKSTVGWEVAGRSRGAGHTTGFVDLRQIGFLGPAADHRLRAANLAAVQAEFHRHGARRLVVVGPVGNRSQIAHYTEALPAATVLLVRLHASRDQLAERIRGRGEGGGPPIAGDELRGQPATVLAAAHEAAAAQAAALDRAAVGDVRVDTDGRAVADIAAEIVERAGW